MFSSKSTQASLKIEKSPKLLLGTTMEEEREQKMVRESGIFGPSMKEEGRLSVFYF